MSVGADGHVLIWSYLAVASKHEALHGRKVEEDWWYLAKALMTKIGDQDVIVAYHEHGTEDLNCSLHTREWFGSRPDFAPTIAEGSDQETAMDRVNATLDAVEPIADVEVWT